MSVTKVTGMMQTSTKGGDISSASPTVIDTDGDYFDVTGTTNFAAFTVAAGRRFTVQFDGVLTMTHHATTLDLPGGANITTAAGDVAEFFATGTNTVQCVNYTKADGTAVVAAAGGGNYKNGRTSMGFTAATGTIAVTSMGFTPKMLHIWGAKDGSDQYFFGHFGTQDNGMQANEDTASGIISLTGQDAGPQFRFDGSNRQDITLASLDADGFTLTNTKVGTPTGTGYFIWLALG